MELNKDQLKKVSEFGVSGAEAGKAFLDLSKSARNLSKTAGRWKRTVSGCGLSDMWPIGKWKNKASVQWVIENDWKYLDWAIGENAVLLTNEAYKFYLDVAQECR